MKLGPVSKRDKKSKTLSKNFDENVISENHDVIVISLVYAQFGTIENTDSAGIALYFH